MTLEQKAFSALFYEGLIQRLQAEQARIEHGEDSNQYAMAHAQVDANTRLAKETLDEITNNPIARASWEGYLGGVQRFAGVGDPTFPRWIEFPEKDEEPRYERTIAELFYDELDGWMREFYGDLPLILELILDKGVLELEHKCGLEETWAFFETVASGLDDESGNFGDGFNDDDRKRINEYVAGNILNVAHAVKATYAIGNRTWPIVSD